ncbi:MAG: hypothetical protein FWC78_04875 [Defluviitaleaceae bacterium]|nr:hypothetical protein [Defluviitaleaceae bacterium]
MTWVATGLWVLLWIIVGLLGLVLALLLLAVLLMFVPIKYELKAARDGSTTALLRVSYLFRLVYVVYDYREDADKLTVRIAGIRLNTGKKPTRLTKAKAAKAKKKSAPSKKAARPKRKKTSSLKNGLTSFKKAWQHPHRKVIVSLSWQAIKKSMRGLKPKKIDIQAAVGLGDPANTGLALGAYEVVAGLVGFRQHVRLDGDFEADEAFIRFNAYIRGNINLGKMAMPYMRLVLKKPVRSIIWQAIN